MCCNTQLVDKNIKRNEGTRNKTKSDVSIPINIQICKKTAGEKRELSKQENTLESTADPSVKCSNSDHASALLVNHCY